MGPLESTKATAHQESKTKSQLSYGLYLGMELMI
jgi:hypothetical protein